MSKKGISSENNSKRTNGNKHKRLSRKKELLEKKEKLEKEKSIEIGVIVGLVILILALLTITLVTKEKRREKIIEEPHQEEKVTVEEKSKAKIVNTASKTRPYAVVVNNTPVAVKVQEGLNKAYLVYEFPTEGFTSRLMALYKNVDDLTIGTIRSSRHNFIDYANESDAILVAFGWSHYAMDELNKGAIDHLNGNESKWKSAYWRSNPENLATEHTAYTSTKKINDYVKKNKYRLESKNASDNILLNYSEEEVKLDNIDKVKTANKVTLPYGNITTVFKYNKETKEYTKYVNGKEIKDHKTKEKITTKNIIVVKIGYKMASDNYYWDLKDTGSGDGYYITNGKSVPIKWTKATRNAKSKYTYLNGEEIKVNDGRTYIEIHTTKKKVTIE